jgi:hypothetical protein
VFENCTQNFFVAFLCVNFGVFAMLSAFEWIEHGAMVCFRLIFGSFNNRLHFGDGFMFYLSWFVIIKLEIFICLRLRCAHFYLKIVT